MMNEKARFGRDDVEIIATRALYSGFFKMIGLTLRHRLFKGGWSEPMTREIFDRGHAAVLLPYDPLTDEVVMQEQFRPGALESDSPWLLELVAGIIEEGESPAQVAVREAQEEAGLEVKALEPIHSYLASPGGCTERISLFVGQVDASAAQGIHGLAEEHEEIRVHRMSREQAYQLLLEGKIDNAATLIALQWLQLNYQALRQRWCS